MSSPAKTHHPSDPARSILTLTRNDFFRLPIEEGHYAEIKGVRLPKSPGKGADLTYEQRVRLLFRKYDFFLNQLLEDAPDPEAFFGGTGIRFARGEKRSLSTIRRFQNELMAGILRTIEYVNDGQIGRAYSVFTETVSGRWEHFSNFISYTEIPQHTDFFRMREIQDENDDVKPEAMFHVPYSLRHIVGPERFSIAGYPCFYLAESIRVCWEELGRPDFERSHVARYVTSKPFQLLDLSVPCWSIGKMSRGKSMDNNTPWETLLREPETHTEEYNALKEFGRRFYTYIMLWPLAASCLMHARFPEAHFKAEYILPQFLLQMIRDRKLRLPKRKTKNPGVQKDLIDGIIFPSTRIARICKPEYLTSYSGLKNLVLVTDRGKAGGDYSLPLADIFRITPPLSIYNFIHYDLATIALDYRNAWPQGSPLEDHAYYGDERQKRYTRLFEKLHWHLGRNDLQDLSFP